MTMQLSSDKLVIMKIVTCALVIYYFTRATHEWNNTLLVTIFIIARLSDDNITFLKFKQVDSIYFSNGAQNKKIKLRKSKKFKKHNLEQYTYIFWVCIYVINSLWTFAAFYINETDWHTRSLELGYFHQNI